MMKIVAVACARDEIDVIEAFVRHTLAWVDRLVVLDNGSTDGTREVLAALCAEGLALEVVDDPSPGKYLSRRNTRLMREHALGRHRADWIVPLDADEFIHVGDGRPLIPDWAKGDQPLQLHWRTYVPAQDDDPAETNPVIRLRQRLTREAQLVPKVIVPARHAGDRAVIAQGSHGVEVDGRPCSALDLPHGYLAHFPVRSPGQFIAKTVVGHLQNEVMAGRPPSWGHHHRTNFAELRRDPIAFSRDFAHHARNYVGPWPEGVEPETTIDPFPYRGGPLRHTPPVDDACRAWAPVLDYGLCQARDFGLLRAALTSEGNLWFDNLAHLVLK